MMQVAFGWGGISLTWGQASPSAAATCSINRRALVTCAASPPDSTRKIPALRRPVLVTGKLLDLCPDKLMPRNEVSKAIMRYVKEKNLQQEGNHRRIVCDSKLRELFNTDDIDVIRLQQAITPYLQTPGKEHSAAVAVLEDEIRASMPEPKSRKYSDPSQPGKRGPKPKRKRTVEEVEAARAAGKGIWKVLVLSKELSELCGGATTLARPDIVKSLWAYFKSNNLQDPKDGRVIKCDATMRKVFGNRDDITAFSLNKWISQHVTSK